MIAFAQPRRCTGHAQQPRNTPKPVADKALHLYTILAGFSSQLPFGLTP